MGQEVQGGGSAEANAAAGLGEQGARNRHRRSESAVSFPRTIPLSSGRADATSKGPSLEPLQAPALDLLRRGPTSAVRGRATSHTESGRSLAERRAAILRPTPHSPTERTQLSFTRIRYHSLPSPALSSYGSALGGGQGRIESALGDDLLGLTGA
jgi:hypothetical protein